MKYRITAEGVLETGLSGFDLINFPMLNKGNVSHVLRVIMGVNSPYPVTAADRRALVSAT